MRAEELEDWTDEVETELDAHFFGGEDDESPLGIVWVDVALGSAVFVGLFLIMGLFGG